MTPSTPSHSLPRLRQALGEETRTALIDAATRVFIDEGFRAARVQTIAECAGTRLSAINYHFGGKEGLYRAVLQHHAELAIRHTPLPSPGADNPREALAEAIRMIVRRFLDPATKSSIGQLMLRELMNPTAALQAMIARFSLPQSQLFRPLVKAVLGAKASDEMIDRAMISIFSQCMGYVTARPLIEQISPSSLAGEDMVERVTAHIATFSWGGLMALRASLEETT
mgnify:CR=1 FL=1